MYFQNTIGSWVLSKAGATSQMFPLRKIIMGDVKARTAQREGETGPGMSPGAGPRRRTDERGSQGSPQKPSG